MSNFNRIKRAKYMSLFFSFRSYLITKNIKIKTDKSSFKKLIKNNKKSELPHIILSTYGSKVDPFVMQRNLHPGSTYHVFIAKNYSRNYPILRMMGKRFDRFKETGRMINAVKKAIRLKNNVVIYPEQCISRDGTTSRIPREVIKLLKMIEHPVMVCVNHGTYACAPIWRKDLKSSVVTSELTELFTVEDLKNKSEDELYNILLEAMYYDDYMWQKKENVAYIDKARCEGIENILYKCPGCLEENKMTSKGVKIYCLSCGKQWIMTEYGDMKASMDDTEYASLKDWYNFQRDCVKEEVYSGNYKYVGKVKIRPISNSYGIKEYVLGVMWHNTEGIIIKFNLGQKEEIVVVNVEKLNQCEINYNNNDKDTCIEIPYNDTIYKVRFNINELSLQKFEFVNEVIYDKFIGTYELDKYNKFNNEKAITVDVEDLLQDEEIYEKEIESAGQVIAVEYVDDGVVTSQTADKIRQSAKTVTTDEV